MAPLQLALIGSQILFRPLSASPLNQQACNKHRLRNEECEPAQDVVAVPIPARWVSKTDDRPGREAAVVDAPPAELAPVNLVPIQTQSRDRDAVGGLAMEHAQCKLPDPRNRIALAVKTATDDPMAHRGIDPAVGWRVRGSGYSIDVLEWMKLVSVAILGDEDMVDGRMRGKL